MLLAVLAAASLTLPAAQLATDPPPLRVRVADPEVIRIAVKEAIAASPDGNGPRKSTVLGSTANASFARAVDEARVPDCLHPDAMKRQPPKIGPIDIGGIFVIPFWISAIVRGKCNVNDSLAP